MITGCIVWFTGLPASGKSTLARTVRAQLGEMPSVLLDSDELREVLGASGYDDASRDAFYAALRALAIVLARQGLVVLVAATAARREHRRIDAAGVRVHEVHVATPVDECEARDPKGLFAAARAAPASTLPGVGIAYEAPLAPAITASGGEDRRAVDAIVALVTRDSSS